MKKLFYYIFLFYYSGNICLESIPDGHEKENLVKRIAASDPIRFKFF
jgi:hypothetical protein